MSLISAKMPNLKDKIYGLNQAKAKTIKKVEAEVKEKPKAIKLGKIKK